jgi:hypothetical protein
MAGRWRAAFEQLLKDCFLPRRLAATGRKRLCTLAERKLGNRLLHAGEPGQKRVSVFRDSTDKWLDLERGPEVTKDAAADLAAAA